MNDVQRARLVEVAEWLERGGDEYKGVHEFNMRYWDVASACGTLCCVGGAIEAFNREAVAELRRTRQYMTRESMAAALVGIDAVEAYRLFYPDYIEQFAATAKDVAKVVRHLIDTGKVDWSKAA